MQAWFIQRRRPFLVGTLLLLIVALTLIGIGRFAVHAAGSSTLRLSTGRGTPGQVVKVTGLGFGPSETVVLMLGTMPLHSALSTANGSFATSFIVPATPVNSYTISATGKTSHNVATALFKVYATITLSGKSTYPANPLKVRGQGFGASETITLFLCSTPLGTTPLCTQGPVIVKIGQIPSASNGSFSTSFNIPYVYAGSYTVRAEGTTSRAMAHTSFVLPPYPVIVLSPQSSVPGGNVKVQGQGFGMLEGVAIGFNGATIVQGTSDPHGKLKSISFVVPKSISFGSYTVTATGYNSGLTTSAPIQITSTIITLTPTSSVPGATVKVQGQGFGPQETITITVGSTTVAQATSDTHGNLPVTSFVVPGSTADGSYTVTATGSTSGKSASTSLKVTSSYTITTFAVPEAGAPINGINNAGQMVGGNFYGGSAFVGVPGKFTSFNSPPSLGNNNWDDAVGINNLGQMVGTAGYYDGNRVSWLDSGGSFAAITVPNSQVADVYGINDSGQVVGQYADNTSNAGLHGFLYSSGAYTTIDVPGGGYTIPKGIDNAGEIVGYFIDSNGNSHGFSYSSGAYTTIDVPGATDTSLCAISSSGEILGYSSLGYFLYDGKTFTTINIPGPTPNLTGINDSGDIAGYYQSTNSIVDFLATPA